MPFIVASPGRESRTTHTHTSFARAVITFPRAEALRRGRGAREEEVIEDLREQRTSGVIAGVEGEQGKGVRGARQNGVRERGREGGEGSVTCK